MKMGYIIGIRRKKMPLTPFDQAQTNALNFVSSLAIQIGCAALAAKLKDAETASNLGFNAELEKATLDQIIVVNATALEENLGVSA